MVMVKACPVCGKMYTNHCWHPDREETYTKEMDAATALGLLCGHLEYLLSEVDSVREHLAKLSKILAGEQV